MKSIAILGATGSIGTQALDLARRYPERFRIDVLTAHQNAQALFALAREFRPRACGLVVPPDTIPEDLRDLEWYTGPDASVRALEAIRPQYALCAVVGIAGLPVAMAAVQVCERVLMANKEALVTGGAWVTEAAARRNVPLVPVDSEHSAIYQCLQAARGNPAERLILTCSGGALRDYPATHIADATVHDVLQHPTWRMGGKITVDCATLMNKGLEVIEAHYLFGLPVERIDAIIHRESVIHSMVEFADGAVLAQLAAPDMRGPIGYAMGEPDRLPYGGARLDFRTMGALTFAPIDTERFPCFSLALDALRAGKDACIVLNAANEVAVAAFMRGEISFGRIAAIVRDTLEHSAPQAVDTIEAVYALDAQAREYARHIQTTQRRTI